MVISLFPKRRRRRRWHGLLTQEVADPPSFSEIQPEITVRDEETCVPEVSVDVPATPVSRSRRKSTIGTPALRERSANCPGEDSVGTREEVCEPPDVTANFRRGTSTIETSAQRELSASQLEMSVDENNSEVLDSTRGSARCSANAKSRTSVGQYLEVPETMENTAARRRSSRLLEKPNMLPSNSPYSKPALDSSRTSRRVSFSILEPTGTHPVSCTSGQGEERDSLATRRFSALSDAEENSEYHAFIDGVPNAKVPPKNHTRCSRGSMTNPDLNPNPPATMQIGTVKSDDIAAQELNAQPMLVGLDARLRTAESRLCTIQVTAPSISRPEFKTVRRIRKLKPETRDARTSTTGLDDFARSTRGKRSICVQIDLDMTTAFKNADPNSSISDDSAASSSEDTLKNQTQSSQDLPRARAEMNISVTEPVVLPQVSGVADPYQTRRSELPPEAPTNDLGQRIPTILANGLDCEDGPVMNNDGSRLGIDVSIETRRKARGSKETPRGKSTAASPGAAEPQAGTTNQDLLPGPVVEELLPELAVDVSRFQARTGRREALKSADNLKEAVEHSEPALQTKDTSETSKEPLKRKIQVPVKDPSAPPRVNEAKNSSTTLTVKSKGCVSLTSEFPGPAYSEHEKLFRTPSPAKRCRTAREPKRARRRSSDIDILSIAQRIKEKIERKRLIENTIYRRVNLIYEGLWEDFLQTYCPAKWLKVKEAWYDAKARKRLEEEERGLGDLDDQMELEVQRGTELGAAKYIKEFEEKRAQAERRARISGDNVSQRIVQRTSLPLTENRRQSRRLRDLLPL